MSVPKKIRIHLSYLVQVLTDRAMKLVIKMMYWGFIGSNLLHDLAQRLVSFDFLISSLAC